MPRPANSSSPSSQRQPLLEAADQESKDEQNEGTVLSSPATDPLIPPMAEQGQDETAAHRTTPSSSNALTTTELVVTGMTCTMCSQAISRAVQMAAPNLQSVNVAWWNDTVTVAYDEDSGIRVQDLVEAIQDVGYDVQSHQTTAATKRTMQTASSSELRSLSAEEVPSSSRNGKVDPLASAAAPTTPVSSSPLSEPAPPSLTVEQQEAQWQQLQDRQAAKVQRAYRSTAAAWIWGVLPTWMVTMVVMPLLHARDVDSPHPYPPAALGVVTVQLFFRHAYQLPLLPLVLCGLATFVQVWCGADYYRALGAAVRHRTALGMDVLIAVGTSASFVYALSGVVEILWLLNTTSSSGSENNDDNDEDQLLLLLNDAMNRVHFFETSTTLIAFVRLGQYFQVKAVQRTSQALTDLLQLQSTTAILLTPILPATSPTDGGSEVVEFDPFFHAYTEREVPIQEIKTGQYIKIVLGAGIPADAVVVAGDISVDQSRITGESIPVWKTPGSTVLGGTVCVETDTNTCAVDKSNNKETVTSLSSSISGEATNSQPVEDTEMGLSGAAICRVTGVGSQTALAQIIQLVHTAQTQRNTTAVQSLADEISSVFVPTVMIVSLLCFMTWYALCSAQVVPSSWYTSQNEDAMTFSFMFALACLVISCPCALGLATPTAVMVGTGVGASKLGILIKGGDSLERATAVDTVIFDKTGTLTQGKPVVTDWLRVSTDCCNEKVDGDSSQNHQQQQEENHLLWLLASLERTSEHPLAKAIVEYAEDRLKDASSSWSSQSPSLPVSYLESHPLAQPTRFRALTGRGASGIVADELVAVGNRAFAQVLEIPIPPAAEEQMQRLEQQGKTAILAAINNQASLVIGIADKLKEDAITSVAYLRDVLGVDVWMITGDNKRTADAIRSQLRLPQNRVISEALPASKVQQVRALQSQGRTIAMIGDGVNDSPALAQADVGISVGTGTEIAAEASDMVLVKGNVADVCAALDLSRAIVNRIWWNLLWSLVYNCLGIPVAAGVFYPFIRTRLPPTVAALAMALSSISVVLSSLWLLRYRPPDVSATRRRVRQQGTNTDTGDDDSLRVNLLNNDHLLDTSDADLTEVVDNRTTATMEEGR